MLSVGSSVSLELKRGCDMEEERLYDYARGINAPYWIQEVKTQRKTHLVFCYTYAAFLFCGLCPGLDFDVDST